MTLLLQGAMKRGLLWGLAVVGAVRLVRPGRRLLGSDRDTYEEPVYLVESTHDDFEVRTYEGTLQVQVTATGHRGRAAQQGVGIFAAYIFGGNQSQRTIAMTIPVSAAPRPQTIEMTAPVSTTPASKGWTLSFTMPRQ
ncbi:MAG: hypothetical protein ACJAV2_004892 [Myxococcota bacterium]|jgi:hypothetical protein